MTAATGNESRPFTSLNVPVASRACQTRRTRTPSWARTQLGPWTVSGLPDPTSTTWNPIAGARRPPFHGCRSAVEADFGAGGRLVLVQGERVSVTERDACFHADAGVAVAATVVHCPDHCAARSARGSGVTRAVSTRLTLSCGHGPTQEAVGRTRSIRSRRADSTPRGVTSVRERIATGNCSGRAAASSLGRRLQASHTRPALSLARRGKATPGEPYDGASQFDRSIRFATGARGSACRQVRSRVPALATRASPSATTSNCKLASGAARACSSSPLQPRSTRARIGSVSPAARCGPARWSACARGSGSSSRAARPRGRGARTGAGTWPPATWRRCGRRRSGAR